MNPSWTSTVGAPQKRKLGSNSQACYLLKVCTYDAQILKEFLFKNYRLKRFDSYLTSCFDVICFLEGQDAQCIHAHVVHSCLMTSHSGWLQTTNHFNNISQSIKMFTSLRLQGIAYHPNPHVNGQVLRIFRLIKTRIEHRFHD